MTAELKRWATAEHASARRMPMTVRARTQRHGQVPITLRYLPLLSQRR